jgi:outer membrane protein TolC
MVLVGGVVLARGDVAAGRAVPAVVTEREKAVARLQALRPPGAEDDGGADTTVVARLVQEALASNLSLRQEEIELRQTRAALAKARGRYLPRLALNARYSRSDGGRTIDFPVGDLLNPAYRTLNDLTGTQQFPQVENREIAFLRDREQETTLRLRQPVFNPEILYGSRARGHEVEVQSAAVKAVRRELARDVRVAYYQYRQAEARVDILAAARDLVRENRRASERLRAAGRATQEAVYRAEVEVLDVRQQLGDARARVAQARRYLNVLRNRPADVPIPDAGVEADVLIERRMRAARRTVGGELLRAEGPTLEGVTSVVERRPVLDRLAAAAAAADDRRRAAQTQYLPTVSVSVDAGIQGETYGFSGEQPFVLGSVVLQWSLFDGLQRERTVERRRLAAQTLRVRREDVAQQLGLELRTAIEDVRVGRRALRTAEARVRAARESFRLAERRYEAGRASFVEYTDARTARTEAELNANVTRYDLLVRLARLAYAAGVETAD